MKGIVPAIFLILAACLLQAGEAVPERSPAADTPANAELASITTLDGRTYSGITSVKAAPNKLRIIHESGAVTLRLDQLPEDVRAKFGYDPEKAAAADRADAAAAEQQAACIRAEDAQLGQMDVVARRKKAAYQKLLANGYQDDRFLSDRDYPPKLRDAAALRQLIAAGYSESEALSALNELKRHAASIHYDPPAFRQTPADIRAQLRGVPSGTTRR